MGASFYESGVGSDHESKEVFEIDTHGSRYERSAEEWLAKFRMLLNGRHSIKLKLEASAMAESES